MPSEHLSPLPVANQLPAAQQTKLCSSCHCLLPTADTDSSLLSAHHDLHGVIDANDHSIICRLCRDKSTSRTPRAALQALFVDVNDDCLRRGSNRATELPHPVHIERRPTRSDSLYSPLSATPSSSSTLFSHSSALFSPDVPDVESPASSVFTSIKPSRPFIYSALPPISSEISPLSTSTRFTSSPTKSPLSEYETASAPDPFMDITRLRVRSQPHHCLYPGATFQGTQKSGRHSYDVKVSIVDVDFASSFLCGYLCIRGLTDDWPELTTYFDAEIIGSRYGFLTQNWGANEQEDMTHWARFPAFRHVKNKLNMPHGTINGDTGGAVFMRWKERFLVPDHRVQDINGASFAGFYYVCVDFNSHPHAATAPRSKSSVREENTAPGGDVHPASPSKSDQPRRTSLGDRSMHPDSPSLRSPSAGPAKSGPNAATMSGFYFHQNSEPYQQLSLQHVSESVNTCYELR